MMAVPPSPNHRASLLSGLRTGGVRSVSSPLAQAPHTASPSGTFLTSRKSSLAQQYNTFTAENVDRMSSFDQAAFPNSYGLMPQTAAVDNRMTQQQQQARQRTSSSLNANSPAFVPGGRAALVTEQVNAQKDIARFLAEAMQNPHTASSQDTMQFFHQYNEENGGALQAAYLEALRLTMMKAHINRGSAGYVGPATASPLGSFGLDQDRRGSITGQNQLYGEDRIPQSAGFAGKFSSRNVSQSVYDEQPSTPGRTTIISGGTSLGTPTAASSNSSNSIGPSKSEAAVSWRRGGSHNSVLSGQRAVARESPSPTVRITPPPMERDLSSPATPTSAGTKARPRPLSLMSQTAQQTILIDDTDDTSSNASSIKSSEEHSSPTTPNSFTSCDAPLSPREVASKKLYEGLGFGRPVASETHQVVSHITSVQILKSGSQVLRQPFGPPSNAEEFLPKNFATRIRRKAVGGLGVLMSGRERRLSNVEAK